MKKKYFAVLAIAALYMMTLPMKADDADLKKKAEQFMQKSDLVFIENKGQIKTDGVVNNDIKYMLRTKGITVYLKNNGISYLFEAANSKVNKENKQPATSEAYRLDMNLRNISPTVQIEAKEKTETRYNFYTGGTEHITASAYKKILYKNVYKNIDLAIYTNESGMKYDYIVHPGGNVADIQMKYDGASKISLLHGDLIVSTPLGEIREDAPYTYTRLGDLASNISGNAKEFSRAKKVKSSFIIKGNSVGFKIDNYDRSKDLVIDPAIGWATYSDLGGSEIAEAVASLSTNGTYDYFVTGHYSAFNGDAFIMRYDHNGNLIWSTGYGGGGEDIAMDINAMHSPSYDGELVIHITGYTNSYDLPVPWGWQRWNAGGYDAFVASFNINGLLQWASYYGSEGDEFGMGITRFSWDYVAITGYTTSQLLPPYQMPPNSGEKDAFIMICRSSPIYPVILDATMLVGGNGDDEALDIAVLERTYDYDLYIVGRTNSSIFYTTNGTVTSGGGPGNWDGFMAAYNWQALGNNFPIISTVFGGNNDDVAEAVAIYNHPINGKEPVVTGWSGTKINMQGVPPMMANNPNIATDDAFVMHFNLAQQQFYVGGFIPGNGEDRAKDIVVDNSVSPPGVYITGFTNSTNLKFNNSEPFQRANAGGYDAFVAQVTPLADLIWATYYGGAADDYAYGIAFGEGASSEFQKAPVIVGVTNSTNLPLRNAHQPNKGNYTDAFISMFDKHSRFPTFYGQAYTYGSGDEARDVKNVNGDIVVCGYTESSYHFPRTSGSYSLRKDIFVIKFDANGNRLWATTYGSTVIPVDDVAEALAYSVLDNSIVVTGYSYSSYNGEFGTVNQIMSGGGKDAFVLKVRNTDGTFQWATLYGGSGDDHGYDIAADNSGNIYIVGETNTSNLPGSAVGAGYAGDKDGFIAKFSSAGTTLWRTYYGAVHSSTLAAADDNLRGIAINGSDIYVCGSVTNGLLYAVPTGGPSLTFRTTHNAEGGLDAIAAKYDLNGNNIWSTFIGSTAVDEGTDICVNSAGTMVTVVGKSDGDIRGCGNVWPNPNTGISKQLGFAVALDANGACAYSSPGIGGNVAYFGVTGLQNENQKIALDEVTNKFFVSSYFIVPGDSNAYIARLAVPGSGGVPSMNTEMDQAMFQSGSQKALGIAVAGGVGRGAIVVGGSEATAPWSGMYHQYTNSLAFQPNNAGGLDAFIMKVDVRDGLLNTLNKQSLESTPYPEEEFTPVAGLSNELGIYPNPVVNTARIHFQANAGDELEISVSNLLGEKVMSLKDKAATAQYSGLLDLSGLPAGSYMLQVRVGGRVLSGACIKR